MFEKWAGEKALQTLPLPGSGSYRKYFRINGKTRSAVGVINHNLKENNAFLNFTKHFLKFGLNVPEVYSHNFSKGVYLLQDLGDATLLSVIEDIREKEGFGEKIINFYKSALKELVKFQVVAGKSVYFSIGYPVSEFSRRSYLWDLNYFKYDFLKLSKVPFDEDLLEKDFVSFADFLMSAGNFYFTYRDFQARNIMVSEKQLYFIDYQGGRKGPLHYDPASILFQARAAIPQKIRETLLDFYISEVEKVAPESINNFRKYFYGFALIRILQTLGAYGFRGLYEQKPHFLKSIPLAIQNLKWFIENHKFPIELPELSKTLKHLVVSEEVKKYSEPVLKISINSFSYKRGIPVDLTGNGGGFVFDCRALPNPGRYPKYRQLTGKDKEVIDFLEAKKEEVDHFLYYAFEIVRQTVKNYSSRKFKNLMISFGCTGGQHRSVYCAEKLAVKLRELSGVKIELRHREQERG